MKKYQTFRRKKVTDHDHDNYVFITSELNKLTTEILVARLAQANLVTKTDFNAKLIDFNKRIDSNNTKHALIESELRKLQPFHLSYF